ncbi:unnamed protein product [Knipowitschia caucasica]|uniref:c-Myc-binding protein n=1 Tax=Knipowitschia caucasica TaxID=637954 RepID=A0AAV2MA67_KNICA
MARFHGTPDSKRDQFRRYLEKGGVIDSLTTVLVSLYEQLEKPNNALEFVKRNLGTAGHSSDSEDLQQQISELKQKCAHLTEENKKMKEKLLQYEPEPDPQNGV